MRRLFEIGDEVSYPSRDIPKEDRRLTVIDTKQLIYKSGKSYVRYLYDGLLAAMILEMHARVQQDYDIVVLITGDVGSGKSHLAHYVARHYDPDYRLENTVFNFEEFLDVVKNAPSGSTIILDEAEYMVNKKDFNKVENRTFERFLTLGRVKHFCMILCIPDRMNVMPYVLDRTHFVLDAQVLNWDKRTDNSKGYYRLMRAHSYEDLPTSFKPVGYGTFPKMDAETEKIYLRKKEGSLDSFIEQRRKEFAHIEARRTGETKPGRPSSGKMWEWLEMSDKGMSAKEIAEAEGLAIGTVYNALSKARRIRKSAEDE